MNRVRFRPLGGLFLLGLRTDQGCSVLAHGSRSAPRPSPPAPLPTTGRGETSKVSLPGTPLPVVGRGAGGEGRGAESQLTPDRERRKPSVSSTSNARNQERVPETHGRLRQRRVNSG